MNYKENKSNLWVFIAVLFVIIIISALTTFGVRPNFSSIPQEASFSSYEFFDSEGLSLSFLVDEWIIFSGANCCSLTTNIICNDNINNSFTITTQGVYSVSYQATGKGSNNHELITAIFLNDNIVNKTRDIMITSSGELHKMGSSALLNLSEGDEVDLRIVDTSANGVGTLYEFDVLINKIF